MKKQIFKFILAGFLLLSLITFAQKKTYPVTTINGKEYYQYIVQPSEGLLSIGRKFGTSADEIIKATPEVKDGLKVGQQILIPISKKPEKKSFNKTYSVPEFIQYKVKKKQTLFNVCRKFKVSEEVMIKYNPDIKNGLKEGAILQIPKFSKESNQKNNETLLETNLNTHPTGIKVTKQKYITHKVQPNETLFSISKLYKVDITEITQLNPGSDSKLAVGSELKIPATVVSKSKGSKKDSIILNSKTKKEENKVVEKINSNKNSEKKIIKIAFLLPLMLNQPKNDPSVERFVNFYEGSLLAIKKAKERGISFEIYTYDTEKSEERITELLTNPELKTVDLIIGPAFSELVPIVADFAKKNKINTLIPFTSKVSDIDSNPYLFQFNPGQDSELELILDLITGKYKNTHIVFAELKDISSSDDGKIRVETLQKKMTKAHRSYSNINLTTSENDNFERVLKKGEKNLIIFNSDKLSNVSPFINSLKLKSTKYNIVLFKQYNWRNRTDKMPQSIFISPFLAKFNPSTISEFNLQYDQYFGKETTTDSPRYDLLGYDLLNYFITLIHHFGGKFGNKINSNSLGEGIQSEPLFERSSNNSGFINKRVYLGEDKAQ